MTWMKLLTKACKQRGGFTLLELLMVVIILAILATLALPRFLDVVEKGRTAEAWSVSGAVRSSELRFRATDPSGLYTTDLTKLDIKVTIPHYFENPVVTSTDGTTGFVTLQRTSGPYSGQVIGVQIGSGNACGTMTAIYPFLGPCVED